MTRRDDAGASEEAGILPPPGFVQSATRGPYSTHNGPYFHRQPQGELTEHAFSPFRAIPTAWAWFTGEC